MDFPESEQFRKAKEFLESKSAFDRGAYTDYEQSGYAQGFIDALELLGDFSNDELEYLFNLAME